MPTSNPATKPSATQSTANLIAFPALKAIHIESSVFPSPTDESIVGGAECRRKELWGFPVHRETGNGAAG